MSAVDDAVELINQANISGINAVYGNNLPQSERDNMDKTVVLVTDAANNPSSFGNNDFWTLNQETEVQIWYSRELETDPEIIEVSMMKEFFNQNWQVAAVRQRTLDPDTQQLFNTFYFSRTKNI
ncbi:DUF806 family protein [Lacticaseibacillus paracasei]|uniref:DUF806 family protein n=1 Tax=Lacticaseibacillus paracasei TaxID=1597 RepID=UPI0021A5F819|nr:DUF806 family protein [Lacticaseibacillus paracasei]MCT2892651.1 DUF806 family protein [Lacticaseibacillus paracasei]